MFYDKRISEEYFSSSEFQKELIFFEVLVVLRDFLTEAMSDHLHDGNVEGLLQRKYREPYVQKQFEDEDEFADEFWYWLRFQA